MAQLTDSCFDADEALMPLQQAIEHLQRNLKPIVEVEQRGLAACSDHILAKDLIATLNIPPHNNSAVDGYAVRYDDLSSDKTSHLNVKERIAAGQFLGREIEKNEAVRIFTGAPIPKGADTVMMQEDCTEKDGIVSILPGIKKGANHRSAGEDMAKGHTVLKAGQKLRPAQLAVAASHGYTELSVYRKLKVALFSSGDEVNEVGSSLPIGGIYDANRPMLNALLHGWDCEVVDLGILPDDPESMEKAFLDAASKYDLLVSSAGMSVGEEDHLCNVIKNNGKMNFWKLAIKPGRPVGLGIIQSSDKSTPVLGLPGNPVAAFLTCSLIGRALVQKLSGTVLTSPLKFPCRLATSLKKKAGREEFVRATIKYSDKDDIPVAEKYGRSGAAILSSLQGADGFILLNNEIVDPSENDRASFLPMEGLLRL